MKSILFTLLLSLVFQVQGQDSLQRKYNKLLNDTETFQQFKVIPKTELDKFWSEAVDSLSQDKETIKNLNARIEAQENTIKTLNAQVEGIQASLDASLGMNDSISFMGIAFTKVVYHIIVWVIILVLAILGGMAYMMFIRSNKQTTKFKKELVNLTTEFENHRDKAREQQMKLKRELQTAVNQLNDRR